MTIAERRKRRLVEFIRAVWDEGDSEAAAAYLATTYTIHHDPGDPWDGAVLDLDGYRHRLLTSRAAFPDQRFDIQGLFGDAGAVVMTWLWVATHLADLPRFPASGRRVHMSGATVYFFDEADRLTGHWQVTDRLGVFQQLQRNTAAAR